MTEPFQENELRAAWQPAADGPLPAHRPDCPSPEALLAAIRGEGAPAERMAVLDRALTCDACRREMALLRSVSEPKPAVARTGWQRMGPLALAASLLLAVGVYAVNRWRGDDTVRDGSAGEPALISPAAGDAGSGSVRFVWHPVPGALRYTMEVFAQDGTVLYSATTPDTVLAAPLDSLARGEHRWWIGARMDDGTDRHSEMRAIRLR
jgi:hypothetical protein